MNKYLLSIVIPTYNRPEPLQATLEVILPQVLAHEEVQLKILDNCSSIPAVEALKKAAKDKTLPERISVARHKCNIGGNGNILRTFEAADGDYLWCLGDDDEPAADAVETILADIRSEDFCYAYYRVFPDSPNVQDCPNGKYVGNSIDEWVRRLPSYGARLFISEAVFKLDAVRPYMQAGYLAANAGCPHLMVAYQAVIHGGKYLLSDKQIAKYQMPEKHGVMMLVSLVYGAVTLRMLDCDAKRSRDFWRMFHMDVWSPFNLLLNVVDRHQGFSSHDLRKNFSLVALVAKPSFFESPRRWGGWTVCQLLAWVPQTAGKLLRKWYRMRMPDAF